MPGIITIGLFAFFNAWNELFAALIYLTDSDKYTLPLLLATARTNRSGIEKRRSPSRT